MNALKERPLQKAEKNGVLPLFRVGLIYLLLTLLMTYPAIARLSTHLIGNGDDMWVHYWNNWWVKRVLQQGGDLYHTSLLFHPSGVSLLFHNFAWVNIALWLVLEPIAGSIAAYNLTFLIHIPLCGLGMFLLVRRLTGSSAAAFISGLAYAFWPYRMLHANHPNVIATEVLPFLMLILLRLVEDKRPLREGALAGVIVALIGYTRWQQLILAASMICFYLLYTTIAEREHWSWRMVAGLGLIIIISGALMSPFLYPVVKGQLTGALPEDVQTANFESGKQDILTYIVPQPQHPLAALYDRLFPAYGASATRERYSAFLGHIASGYPSGA